MSAGASDLVLDVAPDRWVAEATAVRDERGCAMFDVLLAVDEGPAAATFTVVLRAWSPAGRTGVRLTTSVPHDPAELPSVAGVWAGAAWHERAAAELFGLSFPGHPSPGPLLLPEWFDGHPLRKDFVLAARAATPWPGTREPGESAEDAARRTAARPRRVVRPPGVPAPGEWGPA